MPEEKSLIPKAGIVILLHGIGHSRYAMSGMERVLARQGYRTLNLSYPSTRYALSDLTSHVRRKIEEAAVFDGGQIIHFVTHSLGGLVAQKYLGILDEKSRQQIGRHVMLGTPNQGSEVADYLEYFLPYRWLLGPAGQELTTVSCQKRSSPSFCETGIIAGTTCWPYALTNMLIDWKGETHDGRVRVESTKIPGMKDHITLPVTHGFLAWSASAQTQTINFLNNGMFHHE